MTSAAASGRLCHNDKQGVLAERWLQQLVMSASTTGSSRCRICSETNSFVAVCCETERAQGWSVPGCRGKGCNNGRCAGLVAWSLAIFSLARCTRRRTPRRRRCVCWHLAAPRCRRPPFSCLLLFTVPPAALPFCRSRFRRIPITGLPFVSHSHTRLAA